MTFHSPLRWTTVTKNVPSCCISAGAPTAVDFRKFLTVTVTTRRVSLPTVKYSSALAVAPPFTSFKSSSVVFDAAKRNHRSLSGVAWLAASLKSQLKYASAHWVAVAFASSSPLNPVLQLAIRTTVRRGKSSRINIKYVKFLCKDTKNF